MATRPALAPKPSQEHALNGARDSEMDGEKDTETAALIASLRGWYLSSSLISLYNSLVSAEVDQLKKLQAAKPIEKKLEDIPRPTKIKSLQDAMGLSEDKKLYSYCRVSRLLFSLIVYG
jgi:hypothetical protein